MTKKMKTKRYSELLHRGWVRLSIDIDAESWPLFKKEMEESQRSQSAMARYIISNYFANKKLAQEFEAFKKFRDQTHHFDGPVPAQAPSRRQVA